MKRFLPLFVICSLFILYPFAASATMIKLTVTYSRGEEKSEQRTYIEDGYWNMPVMSVQKSAEKEKYSLIIEGYNTEEPKDETLVLAGAEFSRKSILLPLKSSLTIENKEAFERQVKVLCEGKEEDTVQIPAQSFAQYEFADSGDCTLTDASFPWNKASVKILKTSYVWTLNEGRNNRDVPDIASGSYTLKIFYGAKAIYHEEFTVVHNAAQNFIYKIEKGAVESLNSYSTSMD